MPLLGDTLSVSSFGSRGTKGSRRSKESGQFWSALRREHFWLEPVPNFKCGSAISLLIHPVPVYVILRVGETKGLGSDNHNKVREKNCHGCFVYNFDSVSMIFNLRTFNKMSGLPHSLKLPTEIKKKKEIE